MNPPTTGGDGSRRRRPATQVGEVWSRPLGDLDLVALQVDGAELVPDFRPTTTTYLATPTAGAVISGGVDEGPRIRLRIVATPARQGTTVRITSATGCVEIDLQGPDDPVGFVGPAGWTHLLLVTVGSPDGPSRTTTISVPAVPTAGRS
ncbi:MAG: hypothetical protein EA387_06570 [Nitriliruptor sp.]|nr:MAG: hypothetical protein EA387_06570 [Nitriliruptor sp.]